MPARRCRFHAAAGRPGATAAGPTPPRPAMPPAATPPTGQGRGQCGRLGPLLLAAALPLVTAAEVAAQGQAAPFRKAPPPAREALAPPAGALDTPEGTLGYAIGMQIGARIADDFRRQQTPVDFVALAQGLSDALSGTAPRLPEERLREALRAYEERMRQEQEAFRRRMAENGKINRAKATKFLAENGKKEGVTTTKSGLQYEVLAGGKGPKPKPTDVVAARYRGTHLDGTVFDESDAAGEPVEFPLAAVVPGWQEALPMMAAGSKWRLWIPPELGYGEEGFLPGIEPNEVLVFEIELVAVKPAR